MNCLHWRTGGTSCLTSDTREKDLTDVGYLTCSPDQIGRNKIRPKSIEQQIVPDGRYTPDFSLMVELESNHARTRVEPWSNLPRTRVK